MVVVVTGLSGAGKSHGAPRARGPRLLLRRQPADASLAPQAVALCERGGMTRVALGIDVRVRAFLGEVGNVLSAARGRRGSAICTCSSSTRRDETLLRRFSETRRPHPLERRARARRARLAVLDGVAHRARAPRAAARARDARHRHDERSACTSSGARSSRTSGRRRAARRGWSRAFVSFGFKYGAPVDADLVLDVRFLDNPYFVPELKPLPGTDPPSRDYVLARAGDAASSCERTRDLLAFVMPQYEREGKSYLTIAHRLHRRAASLGDRRRRAGARPLGVERGADRRRPPRRAPRRRRGAERARRVARRRQRASDRVSSERHTPPPSHELAERGAPAEPRRPKRRALEAGRARRGTRGERVMSDSADAGERRFTDRQPRSASTRAPRRSSSSSRRKFPCDVELAREDQAANAKSVMGVLLLCGSKGTVVEVHATRRPRRRVREGHRRAHRRPVRGAS